MSAERAPLPATETTVFDTDTDIRASILYASEDAFIVEMIDIIRGGKLDGVYVHDGKLATVDPVQGSAGGDNRRITKLDAAALRSILATEFVVMKREIIGGKETIVNRIPGGATLESVLATKDWTGVPPLHGITNIPTVLADGTVQLDCGYSETTKRYYFQTRGVPKTTMPPGQAAGFLLDALLRDIPFKSDADRAHMLAAMFTPLMREHCGVNGSSMITPGVIVNAAEASTGKTLVANLIGAAYGFENSSWSMETAEQKKNALTTILTPEPVVIFDNVKRGASITSSSFEALLTSTVYGDRVLGSSSRVSAENRKLFVWTGNNISAQTEMADRMIPINIDAEMHDPGSRPRDTFAIPDLPSWITVPANQEKILSALVSVMSAWVTSGHLEPDIAWRGFSPWAPKIGSLLDWMGVPGFLGNRKEFMASTEESDDLDTFLSAWQGVFGTRVVTVTEVQTRFKKLDLDERETTLMSVEGFARGDGRIESTKNLGKTLRSQMGRVGSGNLRLIQERDEKGNPRNWQVDRVA